jgi:hypothetical protein
LKGILETIHEFEVVLRQPPRPMTMANARRSGFGLRFGLHDLRDHRDRHFPRCLTATEHSYRRTDGGHPLRRQAGPAKAVCAAAYPPGAPQHATVTKLLLRNRGATLSEIMEATHWPPHSAPSCRASESDRYRFHRDGE